MPGAAARAGVRRRLDRVIGQPNRRYHGRRVGATAGPRADPHQDATRAGGGRQVRVARGARGALQHHGRLRGTFTFDGAAVTHHVEVSFNEAWSGTEQVRVLSTHPQPDPVDGRIMVAELRWERAAARGPG